MRIEIDGREADAGQLWSTASAYGHFTAMQVRAGRTRGLTFHLDRLEAANAELFDSGLDRERVVALIRHALGGKQTRNAYKRSRDRLRRRNPRTRFG